jgi:hypothetical protein
MGPTLRHTAIVSVLCAAAAFVTGCADDKPTTVLLRIERGSIERYPALLRLWIYGEGGRYVDRERVPEEGAPELPDDLVLYPKQAPDTLRLRVEAHTALGWPIGFGHTTVELKAGEQVEATVTLDKDRSEDRDGDGVPDEIDNCPDTANEDQAPCEADGGLSDGGPGGDGGDDAGDAAATDRGPDTVDCDEDGDGYLSELCGGDDCNDKVKAINPGADESGPGSKSCTDGFDNDCDTLTDLGEPGCRQCENAGDCDDKNPCTTDTCKNKVCVNNANVGKSCDDKDPCTKNSVCQANGGCGGGSPVTCPGPAPQCEVPACDSSKGGCITVPGNDGQSCDDGIACTAATCQAGSCVTDTSKTFCNISGSCHAAGATNSGGCVCDPAQSTSDWSPPPNGCKIGSTCYASNAKDPASGCRCVPSQSTTSWSRGANQCEVGPACVDSGASGGACQICDPSQATSGYSLMPSCNNAIVLVGANSSYKGDLGGLSGADAKCATSASAVGLTITAPAFIATSTRDATNMLGSSTMSRKVVNGRGQTLYSSWNAMLSGQNTSLAFYTFDGTEINEPYGSWDDAAAWTGMDQNGKAEDPKDSDCREWTSSSSVDDGNVHEVDTGGLLGQPQSKPCNLPHALLCVWVT